MMQQAQKMQQDMMDFQAELEEQSFSASVGGGMVTATVTGKRTLESIEIKPDAIDPDDAEMLQDMVVAAVNAALEQVEKASDEGMKRIQGSLNLPGLF